MKPPPCFEDKDARKRIKGLCKENKIDVKLLIDLIEVAQGRSGAGYREGISAEISQKIDEFIRRSKT